MSICPVTYSYELIILDWNMSQCPGPPALFLLRRFQFPEKRQCREGYSPCTGIMRSIRLPLRSGFWPHPYQRIWKDRYSDTPFSRGGTSLVTMLRGQGLGDLAL